MDCHLDPFGISISHFIGNIWYMEETKGHFSPKNLDQSGKKSGNFGPPSKFPVEHPHQNVTFKDPNNAALKLF